jgi:plastocyanin
MRFSRKAAGLALALAIGVATVAVPAATEVQAAQASVSIYDNDAKPPGQGFEAGQLFWGYAPFSIQVWKGDQIVFRNNGNSKLPHTVTSLKRGGTAFENAVVAGDQFDSSPAREQLITPGNSWTLDTSTLNQGHYFYYCRLHPWMVGNFSVMEPPSQ